MSHVQYAIDRDTGLVYSRRDNEMLVPVHTQPPSLEVLSVHGVGGNQWQRLVWTKFVPTELKNLHRKTWGMPELPLPPPCKTIEELCASHKVTIYYERTEYGETEYGIRHSTGSSQAALYHWYDIKDGVFRHVSISDTAKGCKQLRLVSVRQ
jgi:hypothetical protein